ncbi:hypothetical protein ACJX0J_042551, partial [Zea mays]
KEVPSDLEQLYLQRQNPSDTNYACWIFGASKAFAVMNMRSRRHIGCKSDKVALNAK